MRGALRVGALVALLHLLPLRRLPGEDRADSKLLFYEEEGGRIRVLGLSFLGQFDLPRDFTLRIDGLYDVVSGASPTGEPARQPTRLVTTSDTVYSAVSGPSQRAVARTVTRTEAVPVPGRRRLPLAEVEDERAALGAELGARAGDNLFAGQIAYGWEYDYTSLSGAFKYTREFNRRNTLLHAGIAYAHDTMDVFNRGGIDEDRDTVDGTLGLTQVVDRHTVLDINLTCGRASGFLSDQYKVAEVDGELLPDNRPGARDRQVAHVAITRAVTPAGASVEGAYRIHRDSYGILAHTASLAWYQKVGPSLVVRPSVRYHVQDAADFYGESFTGNPRRYSADYRLSSLGSLGYGVKVVWTPSDRLSFDAAYERYEMWGRDGKTFGDAYPTANIVSVGVRVWW